jgi:hypothetical protein
MNHIYIYLTVLFLVSLINTALTRAQHGEQPAPASQTSAPETAGQSAGSASEGITKGISHRSVKISNKSTTSLSITVYIVSPKKAKNGMTTTQLTQEVRTLGPKASQTVQLTSEQFVQAVEIDPLISAQE